MSKSISLFSALICTFIWGTTFIAQDTGMELIGPYVFNGIRFFVGLLALSFGSNLLVDGAVDLARILGLSEALIGLTIVSIGTGTPELATALMAAYRKKSDLAIGNAVGSNLFNIMFVVGIAALVSPLDSTGIKESDLYVMMGLSLILLPTVITGRVIDRKEGFIFLAIYIGYLVYLWPAM